MRRWYRYTTGGKKCACNKRDGIEFRRKFEGNRSDCSRKNLCSSVDKEGRKMTNNRGVGGEKKKEKKNDQQWIIKYNEIYRVSDAVLEGRAARRAAYLSFSLLISVCSSVNASFYGSSKIDKLETTKRKIQDIWVKKFLSSESTPDYYRTTNFVCALSFFFLLFFFLFFCFPFLFF